MSLLAAAADALQGGGDEELKDYFDEDEIREWAEFLFRSDTDILILSRKAELIVSLFAVSCVVALHGSMLFYTSSVASYQQREAEEVMMAEQPPSRRHTTNTNGYHRIHRSSKQTGTNSTFSSRTTTTYAFWNGLFLRFWYYAIHCCAMMFYLLPLLTLLSYSPKLWTFMLFLLVGVMYHQWSVLSPSRHSNNKMEEYYSTQKASRRRKSSRQQKQPPTIVATVIATPIHRSSTY